jgi:hypothetical protein
MSRFFSTSGQTEIVALPEYSVLISNPGEAPRTRTFASKTVKFPPNGGITTTDAVLCARIREHGVFGSLVMESDLPEEIPVADPIRVPASPPEPAPAAPEPADVPLEPAPGGSNTQDLAAALAEKGVDVESLYDSKGRLSAAKVRAAAKAAGLL